MAEDSTSNEAAASCSKGRQIMRTDEAAAVKRGRFSSCFSFMEISIDPEMRSLKHLDSKKFKEEIKRWAKSVASYARQVSDHFGSSRR
ncbi:hypothetical protein P3L10_007723 [Capsicum annuum]|uniref:uncharacterized protein LOC124897265 n=1 Tax=Capsicum annuum TaxID=4072 RepID=UPI001FB12621|nr:uncharacterized protein LOC124897265 [Capsicum annuum]